MNDDSVVCVCTARMNGATSQSMHSNTLQCVYGHKQYIMAAICGEKN